MQTDGPAVLVEEYLFPPVEISGTLEQTELGKLLNGSTKVTRRPSHPTPQLPLMPQLRWLEVEGT